MANGVPLVNTESEHNERVSTTSESCGKWKMLKEKYDQRRCRRGRKRERKADNVCLITGNDCARRQFSSANDVG